MANDMLKKLTEYKDLIEVYNKNNTELKEKICKKLNEEQINFIEDIDNPSNQIYINLKNALANDKLVLSEYFKEEMSWFLEYVIYERHIPAFLYALDNVRAFPYSRRYDRRSYRSSRLLPYLDNILSIIRIYAFDKAYDFSILDLLNGNLPDYVNAYNEIYNWNGPGYNSTQIAYALDNYDKGVNDIIVKILTEENNSRFLTPDLLLGVFKSKRTDMYELVCKLLLAAKLQEGLRQAICETADSGRKEAHIAIIKTIIDNNLIRFSSVKRSVGTWLGIINTETRDLERISNKTLNLILDCLTNRNRLEEYLKSDDNIELYVALWSIAFNDNVETFEIVKEIILNGKHHQILVAGLFINSLNDGYLANKLAQYVIPKYRSEYDILSVWLYNLLSKMYLWEIAESVSAKIDFDYHIWFNNLDELKFIYETLKGIFNDFKGKKKEFSQCIFSWNREVINKTDIAELMVSIAAISKNIELKDEACQYIPECSADNRVNIVRILLTTPITNIQRNAAILALADKETFTRAKALEIVLTLELTADEFKAISKHLRFKNAEIRDRCISLLQLADESCLSEILMDLLLSNKEEVRLAGLDIIFQISKKEKFIKVYNKFKEYLKENISKFQTAKETLLLSSLNISKERKEIRTLYNPKDKYLGGKVSKDFYEKSLITFSRYFKGSKLAINEKISDNTQVKRANEIIILLSELINEHRNDEFINQAGVKVRLVDTEYYSGIKFKNGKIELKELWDEFKSKEKLTNEEILNSLIMILALIEDNEFTKVSSPIIKELLGNGYEIGKNIPYINQLMAILFYYTSLIPSDDRLHIAYVVASYYIENVKDKDLLIHIQCSGGYHSSKIDEMTHLLAHPQIWCALEPLILDTKYINITFPLAVALARKTIDITAKFYETEVYETNTNHRNYNLYTVLDSLYLYHRYYNGNNNPRFISLINYLLAYKNSIISRENLIEFILCKENRDNNIIELSEMTSYLIDNNLKYSESLFNRYRSLDRICDVIRYDNNNKEIYEIAKDIYFEIVDSIIESEITRGDTKAEYSSSICNIHALYGVKNFVRILVALGSDKFERTSNYSWGASGDRRSNLSYLLCHCHPYPTDTVEDLRIELKDKNISQKRLIEASLLSNSFIKLIGQYFNIDAYESLCYYFIAHMNEEYIDERREAKIVKFTPLTIEELKLGAFDINWFKNAYLSVDQKFFDMVYDASKYITDGAKHARARKYADAVTNKLDIDITEQQILDKRNKDLLMAYSLIPIRDNLDLFHRYLFIQKFLKESKQFGAQRIASEKVAADIALKNLAINAGYTDKIRLILSMEGKLVDDMRDMLKEHIVDDIHIKIVFNEVGFPSCLIKKNDKILKSIPASLKKNPIIVEVTEFNKTLLEQYRRAKSMFETAMEDETIFTFNELLSLKNHPVVYPMLETLVFKFNEKLGFLSETGLYVPNGNNVILDSNSELKLAHPFDMYKLGYWQVFQKYLFENKKRQVFRQVFRELYIKTDEELELTESLRYAGNQIQPRKTIGVLRNRRFTPDIEEGLQKVYYQENIVVRIYALADWFSPADIEAPTLEWVSFSNRKTGEPIKIKNIPDVIFSEVMRDVDLAVSVAHAGGVDPETSHSTIEMRKCIISYILPMFGIKNVNLNCNHAIIDGEYGEYSVHLGSGVVHQTGGTMIPVLPIHSQHRGKIFLPFIDDDPKTVEIISKILLFADDKNIKDPYILASIIKLK